MKQKSNLETAPHTAAVETLLSDAKKEIVAADQIMAKADENANRHYRAAAEYIAKAQENLASQREIAKAIGKCASWVNQLLSWRDKGFNGSPFAAQSKAARDKKKKRSVAAERFHNRFAVKDDVGGDDGHDDAQDDTASFDNNAGDEESGDAESSDDNTGDEEFGGPVIVSKDRTKLVKLLGMLGSNKDAECVSAARKVEELRKKLDMVWDDLIIPAEI
jgi:hypothetical protein